jgi:serine/threonine protein kinase
MLIPMRLRQYELRSVLGVGGMGTVYQATDLLLQRDVAAKLIRPELAENRAMLEAFLREARYAASPSHTNIIAIHSLEESEGHSLLTMELAAGGSLGHRIALHGRLPELQVLDLGIKIASALAAALDKRLLHRDVKPGNILFNAAGEPKLADFGLARAIEEGDGEAKDAPWATPHYTAPERVLGQAESFATDLYSLAATLYHAATGVEPFNAPTVKEVFAAHVRTPLTPPTGIIPELSQPTSDVLTRAMAKTPADRYESYDAFIMALTAARSRLLIQQFGPRTETESAGPEVVQSRRRWLFAGSRPS